MESKYHAFIGDNSWELGGRARGERSLGFRHINFGGRKKFTLLPYISNQCYFFFLEVEPSFQKMSYKPSPMYKIGQICNLLL